MPKGNSGVERISLDTPNDYIDPASVGAGSDGGTIRDANGTEFDPTIHSSPDTRNADGSFRRKRGRKAGSGGNGNRSRASVHSDIKETAVFLAQGLLLFHTSMAAMTGVKELVLEDAEAQGLAESGLTLAAMYDIQPDPKLQAAILFAGQVGMIYGTRLVAYRARKSQEKEERRKGTAGMYDGEGNPIGTTSYSAEEWPVEQTTASAPLN